MKRKQIGVVLTFGLLIKNSVPISMKIGLNLEVLHLSKEWKRF